MVVWEAPISWSLSYNLLVYHLPVQYTWNRFIFFPHIHDMFMTLLYQVALVIGVSIWLSIILGPNEIRLYAMHCLNNWATKLYGSRLCISLCNNMSLLMSQTSLDLKAGFETSNNQTPRFLLSPLSIGCWVHQVFEYNHQMDCKNIICP